MVSTSIEDLFMHLLYHLSVNLKRRNSFDLGFGIETVMRVSTLQKVRNGNALVGLH